MTNTVIVILLLISLITNIFLLYVTVHNCRSDKKNWFIFCLVSTIFYMIGNFMEITSHDTFASLNGVKIMYVGACFMAPLFLLFTLDYCEINFKSKVLKMLLLVVPTINLVLVWTTEYNHLVYTDFSYTADATVRGLLITQGPAYYVVYGYALLCICASVGIIISRMIKWNKSFRMTLILLMLSGAAPLIANGLYILSSYVLQTNLHGVNLTPFSLIITYLLFYVNVLRHDLFDFAPSARFLALNMIRDGIVFLDENKNYTSSNEIAQNLFPGLKTLGKGLPITNMEEWPAELKAIGISDEYQNIQFAVKGPGGEDDDILVFNAWVNTVRNGGRVLGFVVLIQDITDNTRLLNQLEEAASTDGLTGLYNRKYFMELASIQLERARRTKTPSAVLLFDLDFFKVVNDTYGHLAGDAVLKFFAQHIKHTVRAYDIAARYGGEEFVVFLPDTSAKDGVGLAERIRRAVESSYCVYEDVAIAITCSIGVTEAVDGESTDSVLKRADSAMYQAKETGRNRVCIL